ncbi:pentapeptide repeat-containing protein [Fulvitalea axinellae]
MSEAVFDNAIFNSTVEKKTMSGNGFSTDKSTEYIAKAHFQNANFYSETTFENTTFKDLADFSGATFHRPQTFLKTDLQGTTILSRARFKENLLFTYAKIEGNAIFRHTLFDKGLDLALANITGKLSFFKTEINTFPSQHLKEKTAYDNAVEQQSVIPYENQRETFRIIKDTLYSQNNRIEGLRFRRLELKAFEGELQQEKWSNPDKFINCLNGLSNKHGQDWIRSAWITLALILSFYCLLFVGIDWPYHWDWSGEANEKALTHFIRHLAQFALPTHKITFMEQYNPTPAFYIIDFLARIFIGYGIYQTVAAFRKFGKN